METRSPGAFDHELNDLLNINFGPPRARIRVTATATARYATRADEQPK